MIIVTITIPNSRPNVKIPIHIVIKHFHNHHPRKLRVKAVNLVNVLDEGWDPSDEFTVVAEDEEFVLDAGW